MLDYAEHAPPPHLADAVECVWSLQQTRAACGTHRVVPDGCADILFTRKSDRASLQVVGPMTKFEDFPVPPNVVTLGIRFRPGMWSGQFQIPAISVTDRIVPLEELWGQKSRTLLDEWSNAKSVEECFVMMTQSLRAADSRTPIQRALAWMEQSRGQASLDWLARQAGLSARQFRRACLQHTGLSPKFLARVLRFRHALSQVHAEAGAHAGLAADCGYTDQSHFISEFREFSGRTPSEYLLRPVS